jgi:hypothetical protein
MTHIWKIDNVERLTESGLITRIDYSCSTEHSGHTESHHGELELEGDITATDFIAYEDLTELQILDWVYSILESNELLSNKLQIEQKHSTAIVDIINAINATPIINSGLPWG